MPTWTYWKPARNAELSDQLTLQRNTAGMAVEDEVTSLKRELSSFAVLLESPAKFYNEFLQRSGEPLVQRSQFIFLN